MHAANDKNATDSQTAPEITHDYMDENTKKQITECFYHRPVGDQPKRYLAINDKMREFMTLIATYCPSSRERSLAFTKLEECRMWANAAIAKNEKESGANPCFKKD